ncbi:DENN domain-containing protein 1B [Electrophorus electricus]|uniref:UDENN domain-containing protein n=1 Tax=Electrophorus electricus TaxID=8005 RepID=A0A4W4GPB9_ELEEL|nr:DENN domain-containing protein 1B [Electrophorus electricus]
MGSRLKETPDRPFYWFFQASCPIARDKDPGLLFQFPEDFSDEECMQSLPQFCFPYDIERVKDGVAVQHFTFVLTDLEGCQRFGFCRLTSSSQTCLCILSYLPWFEVFYKLLNNLADYLTKGQINELQELLMILYKQPVPMANDPVTMQLIPYFIAPDPKALPSIPESRNLTELVVAVDVGNLMQLYASMLFERRILICCSKLSTLTACVHACAGMLFPMYWQHIFIPVLPPHLLDYCCAPMPYLIGIHSSLMERVRSRALEDVVILNVDTNTMESDYEDLKKLPPDVVAALKVRLKRQASSPGTGVARSLLRAQAVLFGGYRDALLYPAEGPVLFSEEMFLTHKSHSMRQFLESSIHLQFFKQFIDERLEMLNQGKIPDDLFEEEILQCGASSGSSKPYQQWVGNLKKGGDALILTVKSKAQLYKSAKCSRLKNLIQPKQKESHSLQRGGSMYRLIQSDCLQNRLPITQHFGKSRPRRPARKHANLQEEESPQENSSWVEESHGESGSSGGHLQEDPELSMLTDPEEMDLLGEIFDTLNAQSSREPGLLYSTRSLDLFSSDCTDYITRRSLTTPSQESLSLSIGNSGSLKSWEEGLEEGPYTEEEGFEVLIDETERDVIGAKEGHGISGEELCVDLGSLMDEPKGLGEELKEEPGDHHPVHEVKENDSTGEDGRSGEDQRQEGSIKDQKQNNTTEEEHDLNKEHKDLEAPYCDSPQKKESLSGQEVSTDICLEPLHEESFVPNQSCQDERGEEEERGGKEESGEQLTPLVLSTVAMLQAKASQTRISPETAKSGYSLKGSDMSLKSSARGPMFQASSSRPVSSPQTEDHVIKPANTTLTDSSTEDQDLPSIKVSELKKRFEL